MLTRKESTQIKQHITNEIRKYLYPLLTDGKFDAGKRSSDSIEGASDKRAISTVGVNAEDWQTVGWTSGTVYLSNGITQSIDAASSLDMENSDTYFLYVKWGNSTIQTTQVANEAIGLNKLCIAVCSRGADSNDLAFVLKPDSGNMVINTNSLMDNIIVESKITNRAITDNKIALGAIKGVLIANDAITETKIENSSISSPKIRANTIIGEHIIAGEIIAEHIGAGQIVAGKLAAGSIQTHNLQSKVIKTEHLTAGIIDAEHINAGQITSDHITTDAIVAKDFRTSANVGEDIGIGGVKFDSAGIHGYVTGTTKGFYLGIDGRGYCAQGGVVFNEDGIKLTANDTGLLQFTGDSVWSKLYNDPDGFYVWTNGTLFLNADNAIKFSHIDIPQSSASPAKVEGRVYYDTDTKKGYICEDDSWEELSGGGGGDITTDDAWVAKGDLIGATGNDTASILSVGDNDYVLTADSGETTGMKWAPASGIGANLALSNLSSVAINTTLVSDTNNEDDLGTDGVRWKDLYLSGDANVAGDVKITDGNGLHLIKGDLNGRVYEMETAGVYLAGLSVYADDGHLNLYGASGVLIHSNLKADADGWQDLGNVSSRWGTVYSENYSLKSTMSTDHKYSGITISGFAGYGTTAVGDLIYLASADGKWEKADADAEATTKPMLGIALWPVAENAELLVLLQGFVRDDGFSITNDGAPLYVGLTAGAIVETVSGYTTGDCVRIVGHVHDASAHTVYFNPDGTWLEVA